MTLSADRAAARPVLDLPLRSEFADQFANRLALPWEAARFPDPRVVVLNAPLVAELGLDPDWLESPEGTAFLAGASLPERARPVAQAYAGHQFGNYSPRLGDGRALLLGEIDTPEGLRDLHLKGSGRTPFARGGDGLAALGPMLREFVISEAMHALSIPTTRSLAVVATGRDVYREEVLPGALLVRTASSHLRVGSFQFAAATGDRDLLRDLADHAIERHYPAAAAAEVPALALLEHVVQAQADLVAHWMLVGFLHGVMNSDNTTISGESIDYGPCAFLDEFNPATVFSSIDHDGRYAYGNQPLVLRWNLARLAEAILPLIDPDVDRAAERAVEVLTGFLPRYESAYLAGMRGKLGLAEEVDADTLATFAKELLDLLEQNRVDYTSFFRALSAAARGDREPARSKVLDLAPIDAWLGRWLELSPDADAMDQVNPVYIPRNHIVEEALAAATDGDLEPFERLVEVVRSPFTERAGLERYAEPAPAQFTAAYATFCGT